MKKLFLVLFMVLCLTACGKVEVNYPDEVVFENELNEGADLVGKVVHIKVRDYKPQSAFGYNIIAGEHLNFVSSDNPKIKVDDELDVKVTEVRSVLGSWIIDYDRVN